MNYSSVLLYCQQFFEKNIKNLFLEKIKKISKKVLTFFEWWCIITFVSCESNRQGTRRWRNRQTRRLQVPVVATSCGFKSHSPHRSPVSVDTGFFYVLSKADIRNPSLQLCWQGLASLLAHERSRFAICQWELSTPTDISIPPHPPLSAPRTWSGGMLICVHICFLCRFLYFSYLYNIFPCFEKHPFMIWWYKGQKFKKPFMLAW